jgi:hypothetical protein
MMALLYRTSSKGEDLGTVDQLDQILEENKDPEGGYEKDKSRGFLVAKGVIDKPVNSYANDSCQDRGKKKLRMGLKPSEIIRV